MIFLLKGEGFIKHKPTGAREAAHVPSLLPVRHQLKLESLQAFHAVILYSWGLEDKGKDSFAVRAILSALKGEVCRAS